MVSLEGWVGEGRKESSSGREGPFEGRESPDVLGEATSMLERGMRWQVRSTGTLMPGRAF